MMIRGYIHEEQNESWSAYKITASVLVVLWALVFCVLMIYSYKFFKIYRFKSKWLALFLIMINLSVLTRMGNFIQELIVRKDSCTNEPPIWLDSVATFLNIELFIYAAMFHLFNWQYQIWEIKILLSDCKNYK